MSMNISIDKNAEVSVHYHGKMVIPKIGDYQVYRWKISYLDTPAYLVPREVTWDSTPPNNSRTKGEKRIKDLTLKLWQKDNAPGDTVSIKTSNENGMSSERHIANELLDVLENFLRDKGVALPSEEKNEYDDDTAILFGSDYYTLEDKFTQILKLKSH